MSDNTSTGRPSADVIIKTFLAGGLAGCFAKTAVAPLDRVKILLQAHSEHYKDLGVIATHRSVIMKEGFLSLFQGNGVQMIRIFPYAAIQFLTFEQFSRIFRQKQIHKDVRNLCAGTLAGFTAVLSTYPLDMIRARLAFQVKGNHIYIGIVDVMRSIVNLEGGLRGLYRGMTVTILGMAPYAGLSFYGFETLKSYMLDNFPHLFGITSEQSSGGVVLSIPAKLLCGGIAGAFAQTLSYPLDVVRRRIQLSAMVPDAHKYQGGLWKTLVVIYQEHGLVQGIFRGLSINYLRVVPTVSVSFCTYEMAKQALGLDAGVKR